MATTQLTYAARQALTISLASLASSSGFTAGQESNEVDNTTNRYLDALVQGRIRVGTTPTVNTQILVFAWGADQSLATLPLDVLDGTDSAETITSAGVRNGMLKLLASLDVDATTSDRDYYFPSQSVAQLFGGILPAFWGLFVTHNTGVALNATAGNHVISYRGVELDAA